MDWERVTKATLPMSPKLNKAPVAVVGSGPAGLGCAAELAQRGHPVTIFEADKVFGGMLRQSIPSFRLPIEVVDFEIELIKKLGVEFVANKKVDDPKKLLKDKFKAIFIATGLHRSKGGDLIGDHVPGVCQALDFLRETKKGKMPEVGKRALIIGGGDTALDAARVAKRSGAESFIIYRRTQNEMPAYPNEVEDAWHEGVEFYFRVLPRGIVGEDKVKGLRCVRIKWNRDGAGKPTGYDIEAQEFAIDCDSVILAIGQDPESTFDLRTTPSGYVAIGQDSFKTSEEGIYAAGDVTYGGGTAAKAVGMGKLAAIEISDYLNK